MTKKLLALLATVVLTATLVLAGCSRAEEPTTDEFFFDDFLLEEVETDLEGVEAEVEAVEAETEVEAETMEEVVAEEAAEEAAE